VLIGVAWEALQRDWPLQGLLTGRLWQLLLLLLLLSATSITMHAAGTQLAPLLIPLMRGLMCK